jgi:hypothetical protein
MRPSPAEVVRTLVAARGPGQLHLPESTWPVPVAHGVAPDGTPLLLVDDDAPGADALPAAGADDVAALCTIPDETAYPAAPSDGEAALLGWVAPVPPAGVRAAADAFAAVNPLPALLDIGRGQTLHRLELAEIRLDGDDRCASVDLDAYRCARPDPVRLRETELLADLNDHHPEIRHALLRHARMAVPTADAVLPVRVDRHGLVLRVLAGGGPRHLRLAFRRPVADHADLAATLRALSCHRAVDADGVPQGPHR